MIFAFMGLLAAMKFMLAIASIHLESPEIAASLVVATFSSAKRVSYDT